MGKAAQGSKVRAKTRLRRTRPGLPLVARAQHHQTRVQLNQRRIPETESLDRTRCEVLHDDIRALDQTSRQGTSALGLQVQGDAAFAVIEVVEDAGPLNAG